MQDLKVFITEKLDITKDYSGYNYQPKDKKELQDLLEQLLMSEVKRVTSMILILHL